MYAPVLPSPELVPSTVILLNATSGKQRQDGVADAIAAVFRERGVDPRVELVREPRRMLEAARSAVRAGARLVIAGGGDGTINAVASVLVGTETALGVIPLGTFNYFARRLGIPADPVQAALACAEGKVELVNVGEVNGRMFLNNASLGLYPNLLAVREAVYRRWGRSRLWAYVVVPYALLRTHRYLHIRMQADTLDTEVRSPLLFAMNNAFQLEEFQLIGRPCVESGRLALYVIPPCPRANLLRLAWRTLRRRLKPAEDFRALCSAEIRVHSTRRTMRVAIDGEVEQMSGPFHFRVRRDALRVVVPPQGAFPMPANA